MVYPLPFSDVLVLDGGINDIGFGTILFDTLDQPAQALEIPIAVHCYQDVIVLLRQARKVFPTSTILLLGYYPILGPA
jgi:hypothetical protein